MIDITTLTATDVGREVRYSGNYRDVEYGRITSWNTTVVFVRYHSRVNSKGEHIARTGETSEATYPHSLEFVT